MDPVVASLFFGVKYLLPVVLGSGRMELSPPLRWDASFTAASANDRTALAELNWGEGMTITVVQFPQVTL